MAWTWDIEVGGSGGITAGIGGFTAAGFRFTL
jgi:hypothetical protein